MKVIDWLSYKEAEEKEESVGGMGGFFQKGMRWKDYKEAYEGESWEKEEKYFLAIKDAVIKEGLKVGGDGHQNEYTPLFEDGTVGSFSFRAWGDLMAAIYSEHEDKDYSYMDFYMDCLIKDEDN